MLPSLKLFKISLSPLIYPPLRMLPIVSTIGPGEESNHVKRRERRREPKLNVVGSPSLDLCLPHRWKKRKRKIKGWWSIWSSGSLSVRVIGEWLHAPLVAVHKSTRCYCPSGLLVSIALYPGHSNHPVRLIYELKPLLDKIAINCEILERKAYYFV